MVSLRPAQAKLSSPYLKKQNMNRWTGGVNQMVENRPRRPEALDLVLITTSTEILKHNYSQTPHN
jgi:hypothetical protein